MNVIVLKKLKKEIQTNMTKFANKQIKIYALRTIRNMNEYDF